MRKSRPVKNTGYTPPFTITPRLLRLTAEISETVGRLSADLDKGIEVRLRRVNQARAIQGSLAIEGNTLTEEQITAILNGKRVIAPPREVQKAKNAIAAYERFTEWAPHREADLLKTHRVMMEGLLDKAGSYRQGGGVASWRGNGWYMWLRWNLIFARIPVESLLHSHQAEYCQALRESTGQADSSPFIEFMLAMIQAAVLELPAPQDNSQVPPKSKHCLPCSRVK